jgi:hypothetical protein
VTESESFERATRVYAAAVGAGAAVLAATPSGPANIYVVDPAALAEIAGEADLDIEDLRSARKAISEVLTAHGVGVSFEVYAEAVRSEAEGAEIEDGALRQRYDLVEGLFDTGPLRQQIWNKQTSKTPIFSRLDWEVLEKRVDDDYQRPEGEPVPFAVVQLKTLVRGQRGEQREEVVTFNVDAADLVPILAGFQRLEAALHGEGGSDE